MKLQFDPNQTFQLDAVNAVADLFDGQPQAAGDFSVIKLSSSDGLFEGQERTELGIGNRLILNEDKLRANARFVQERNDIEVADEAAALESWEVFDEPANASRKCPHFSVEMETGTGKTYVYLRTIFELSKRYGFQKFIIVVPSVAIREGVTHSITTMAEHFKTLYNNEAVSFVYSAKEVNKLRQFATSNTLQVLVINIDAFRKNFTGTEDERKSNVIYKEMDRSMGGRAPIEFVQAARPIVIIDEPQSVDATDKAQDAIKALNPLFTLRYSATHKNSYNLVYRLDPVRAFELRLVKQIVVASAAGEGAANDAYIKVESITNVGGIKAKLRIHEQGPSGPKEKLVTVKRDADLFFVSKERAQYRDGYSIAEIHAEPGAEFIRFTSGKTMRLGDVAGGIQDDVWRVQIRHTIRKHFEKEIQVRDRGIKVLSLFFIDRVANYRTEDGSKGKFATVFEEEFATIAKDERYKDLPWLKHSLDKLHDGYFSQDKKGSLKDTSGSTQADDTTYELIMQKKEELLSLETPLRFIFSHSALREGWDNPNVFQICTLNQTQSGIKKRQEIGRGLRLPVDRTGARVFDEAVNRLYVMANESYEEFAEKLQKEYEDDCGVTFGKVPLSALAKITRVVDDQEQVIGKEVAETIRAKLVEQKMLEADGRIASAFDPKKPGFALAMPTGLEDLATAVIDVLSGHQIQRHVRRDKDEGLNKANKQIIDHSPEFKVLWDKIKPRTSYRVEFKTDELVHRAVQAISQMEKVVPPKITVTAGKLNVVKGGVATEEISAASERVSVTANSLPDVLAYLQNETELTRSTLVRILKESGRLGDIFANPQKFMDQVATILKHVLHRLLVDGIKYERITGSGPEAEWEMMLFNNEELINFLTAERVTKAPYEYVVYDSEVEREFAQKLNSREDIKVFMKLPGWFEIETPVGKYNPDWAIVKHDDATLYLVRETKGTKDYLKLRTLEADKVRCGKAHFEALQVPFEVVVSASEV
ncbi:MAG: DEAD/DEAH box helicase family protein [Hyphomicrobiales bacterium]|nr:DEAD/DEAH box helicase family protein [Hyphomicrobiales bacterium]